ncbi:hypothetical protein DL93DRAFT_2097768 [Clavulina sp. PMI_390]|nr:hypothetical protein DL93DRAFT_2097768 [Clavulina sp. PMI_390]
MDQFPRHFPIEIEGEILSHLGRKDLGECSVVSKSFGEEAQRVLFQSLRLPPDELEERPVRSLLAKKHLLSCCKTVNIPFPRSLYRRFWGRRRRIGAAAIDLERLSELYSALVSIRSVIITVSDPKREPGEALAMLQTAFTSARVVRFECALSISQTLCFCAIWSQTLTDLVTFDDRRFFINDKRSRNTQLGRYTLPILPNLRSLTTTRLPIISAFATSPIIEKIELPSNKRTGDRRTPPFARLQEMWLSITSLACLKIAVGAQTAASLSAIITSFASNTLRTLSIRVNARMNTVEVGNLPSPAAVPHDTVMRRGLEDYIIPALTPNCLALFPQLINLELTVEKADESFFCAPFLRELSEEDITESLASAIVQHLTSAGNCGPRLARVRVIYSTLGRDSSVNCNVKVNGECMVNKNGPWKCDPSSWSRIDLTGEAI